MATAELLSNIYNNNIHKAISEQSYTENIEALYKALDGVDINTKFDPEKHIIFKKEDVEKTKRFTMKEFGLENEKQISAIGASAPFPLFSKEAVDIMRAEILRKDVFLQFARISPTSSSGLDGSVRGFARESCPFTYEAWKHPKSIEAVSSMAGVPLKIVMDYEVAHTNVAMKNPDDAEQETIAHNRELINKGEFFGKEQMIPSIVGWHYDSYPFVAVLMLSDTKKMIGGETIIKLGNGKVVSVEGPQLGYCTVLQGRLVEHIAPKPLGYTERLTAVSSYVAADPLKHEESVLHTVKPEVLFGSRYTDFYTEWIDYRMKLIEERAKYLREKVLNDQQNGKLFEKEKIMKFVEDLENYVGRTWKEMVVSDEEYAKAK
ncbi:uncharacterized protein ASCRUDRAFT_33351 [Ascoidea rubescens DSM 1968]|uniref:Fe2OG dioxygenase domain-containing protein n=1 Tax=Ascoidea rubescens DSM 1968 TaxID=1344418 RepID=A0A1D2VKB8_9ASCO|nr:hypothetical protein ASCRUDRAFT_33351 [Ascoidea rubescens DSM 1968]ODV62061.1 hypothetical protein ASCRUDRAFT_33351 [Ascoidea rubescens DSM 1968]